MLKRIQLVVNNHQLSCHHTDKYFYILRGFKDYIDHIPFPVQHDSDNLDKMKNRYILEEELSDFDKSRFEGYKIVELIFNFFEDNKVLKDGHIVSLTPLDLDVIDKVHIFNQIDQLKDVTDEKLNDAERLEYLNSVLITN